MLNNTKYTPSQEEALRQIQMGRDIFLTGGPGTGKTFLLNELCAEAKKSGKKVLCTATTGIAASNYEEGRTIHSVLKYNRNRSEYDYIRCAEGLNGFDIVIIDECSMIEQQLLNHIIKCLSTIEQKPQLIFCGDFFQLPPVRVKPLVYAFELPEWTGWGLYPCVLKEIKRQTDYVFLQELEKARYGDKSCIPFFNNYVRKMDGAIKLCAFRDDVKKANDAMMDDIVGETMSYQADGDTALANFESTNIQNELILKVDMRVTALRNSPSGDYQNGSLGTVKKLTESTVTVAFDSGKIVEIGKVPVLVENKEPNQDMIRLEQIPLSGAAAITIHKAQGQTFDKVSINAPHCWDSGQLYVALSRVRSLEGLGLETKLDPDSLIANPKVIEYYKWLECPF